MAESYLVSIVGDKTLHADMEYKSPGARFFSKLNRDAVVKMELDDPFKDIELYDLNDVDIRPLDVSKIPRDAWPYPNCLFDVLSEKKNAARLARLTDFFLVLGQPGDPSETVGLMYTVMHLWKFFYAAAMVRPTPRVTATAAFFLKAGIFQCGVRILERSWDKQFLLADYNRIVPYRFLELIFAATQAPYDLNDEIVRTVLKDTEKAYNIFYSLISGDLSCMEEMLACQLAANFSCYPVGVVWLLDHPKLVGKIGMHMWAAYDILYSCINQYQELQVPYMKHLVFSDVEVIKDKSVYRPLPLSVADLCIFVILCCLCNVCAAHPEDEPMWRVEPCLLAVVKEGLFTHMGTVIYGIILNDNKYYEELNVEKFLSFLSWSCFQVETQKLAIEQLNSLPTHRGDFPLYYAKDSYSKSRSVIACLMTHACHFDYEKGSHFAMLALIYLLKEDEDVAMELVKVAGDTLFDMAHSIYHAQMPSPEEKPISMKRMVLETILKFSGSSFFSETGEFIKASAKKFEDPVPECVQEARSFCELYVKQMTMKRYEKQKLVRCADEFKAEGNDFFANKDYYSAIECYTRAIETCPLSCTERRVTYYSNRAECYLKTDQSHRALRDCNKSLAMNYNNLKAHWRRAQAFQNMQKRFPAALDLLTIRHHEEEAKQFLGERLYCDLDQMIFDLMDRGRYYKMATVKHGPQVHSGSMERSISLNMNNKDNKLKLPPYRGKYFHEIFCDGHRHYI